jgi:signal transduction histidine kinase/DNA-binding response OmpR family regulator/ligand-binding sensor domain-containing protein
MNYLRLLAAAFMAVCVSCSPKQEEADDWGNEGEMVLSDRISNLNINSIEEDSFGHIWFGTDRGVNRYSVNEFQQFFHYSDSIGLPANIINNVFCDSKNRIWAGTSYGAARAGEDGSFIRVPTPELTHFVQEFAESADGGIFVNEGGALVAKYENDSAGLVPVLENMYNYGGVQRIFATADNRLVVVCLLQVRIYDAATLSLADSSVNSHLVYYSALCKNGDLYLSGAGNLSIFNINSRKMIPLPECIKGNAALMSADIEQMYPVGREGLLLNTARSGVFFFNIREGRLLRQSDPDFPFPMPSWKPKTFYVDSQGNLWTGSEDKGFHVSLRNNQLNARKDITAHFEGKDVLAMTLDSFGNLWVATKESGVEVYDQKKREFMKAHLEPYLTKGPIGTMECSGLGADKEGNVWMAFKSHFTVLKARMSGGKPSVSAQYFANWPCSIFVDESGTVWAGSFGSMIYKLDKGKETFENVFVTDPAIPDIGYTILTAMADLGRGNLMLGNAFLKFRRYDKADGRIDYMDIPDSCYTRIFGKWLIVPTVMKKDSFGQIWIGTRAKGLLCYYPEEKRLVKIPGAPCTDISSIEEDKQGNIWVSTLNGLGKYDRTVGKFSNYFNEDGIGCDQFNERSSCVLEDGTILFGSCKGISGLDPLLVLTRRTVPLIFEGLRVHGKEVKPSKNSPISKFMGASPQITLKHRENEFTIRYSALDYSDEERALYSYKLEGWNNYWVDAGHSHEASFAGIPAGKYVFRVKVSNMSDSIKEVESSIRVRIKPSPWMAWWACLVYLVALGAVAYGFYSLRRGYVLEKDATREAMMEKERQEEMNKINTTFFANIAHEFRTPLTMISGPVGLLEDNKSMDTEARRLLDIIRRSVNWMLQLVGQLMDAGKLTNGKLKARVAQTDVVAQMKELYSQFKINADIKGVEFIDAFSGEPLRAWIDSDKFRKILNNLLSNAFKFTPTGGKVTLSLDSIPADEAAASFGLVSAAARYLKVTVSDTGKGIPEEELEKIFERYYQLDNQSRGTYNWGTGIGLSFARALTELHHGKIKAGNLPSGSGAVFSFILPEDEEAYSEEEKKPVEGGEAYRLPDQVEEAAKGGGCEPAEETANGKPTILVADDDVDIANYLRILLSRDYNVVLCFDGQAAMEKMDEVNPNLVISDVVMPGKSGFELCRMIKSSMQHSHVPVILVTAKVTTESQVEGLGEGADAYVTKPFDPKYLLALVNSVLENRKKLQARLQSSTGAESLGEEQMLPQDKAFMNQLYKFMEGELGNPELDVTMMTEKMKISRTKFYYKVKGLTGENPSVFFKKYKLNRAKNLLKEGKYNMSEIADMTGFSSLSNFSTTFKKQFGVPPSEYKG